MRFRKIEKSTLRKKLTQLPKNSIFKISLLLLCLTLVFTSFNSFFIAADEEGEEINKYGFIGQYATVVRSEPRFGENKVGTVAARSRIEVYLRVSGDEYNGSTVWYKIKDISTKISGYVAADLIELTDEDLPPETDPEPPTDPDFETYLDEQGFPESYRPSLRNLHKRHPQWTFTASHPVEADGTPMKWSTVMAYETKLNLKNSVPASAPISQRSYATGAYNFKTDTWYPSDAGFIYAGPEIIAFYLDPRNFLNEQDIFQFENLSYNSDLHTRSVIARSLEGTFMADGTLVPVVDEDGNASEMMYPDIFVSAAEWSQANPVFLTQRSIQEVGAQGSASVSGTVPGYEGHYNFYNIGAYACSNPVIKGLEYAKYGSAREPGKLTNKEKYVYLLPWSNRYAAIAGGARWISEGYINAGQNTVYYQKFNIDYNHEKGPWWHQYMGNIYAPITEGKRAYSTYAQRGMLSEAHEFIIPVIAELPSEAASFPTDNRSRNNWLKSISLSSGIMAPAFDPEIYEYSVTVAKGVKRITLDAKAFHSQCTINGRGVYELDYGDNLIEVEAVSERGDIRNYFITVTREGKKPPDEPKPPEDPDEPPEEPLADPVLTSEILNISDDYVSNMAPEKNQNTVKYLKEHLDYPEGYELRIYKDGKEIKSGLVGTGTKLSLVVQGEEESCKDYYVLIYGDITGDGVINTHDSMAIYRYMLEISKPSAIEKTAMDITADGMVNTHDSMAVYRHMLEISFIIQK